MGDLGDDLMPTGRAQPPSHLHKPGLKSCMEAPEVPIVLLVVMDTVDIMVVAYR